jgi:hypothetical protein
MPELGAAQSILSPFSNTACFSSLFLFLRRTFWLPKSSLSTCL